MKSMSVVARLSDAPETLDEARSIIDFQEMSRRARAEELHSIKKVLREYLALLSLDGRPERQKLRAELNALLGS